MLRKKVVDTKPKPKPKPKYIKELKQFYINKSKSKTKTKTKMYGGNEDDTFDSDNFDSIMKYIIHKLNNKVVAEQQSPDFTKEKHLIMLYGPQASGKSIAKQIMLSKLNINDDDYIDINLDDIIANDQKYKTELEEIKMENEAMNKSNNSDEISTEIKKRATDLYFRIRNKANLVFELLVFITRLYNISLVVEVTGGTYCSMVWWCNILKFFKSKNYKISIIYPVVSDVNQLISRADKRGREIFRFVSSAAIKETIIGAKKNIKTIIDDKKAMFTNFDNIYIYNNDDENFHKYAATDIKNLLLLFDKNIIYKKENGKITINKNENENQFIKQIQSSTIFFDNNNIPLTPNTCGLTY
jgi:ribosomal protein S9